MWQITTNKYLLDFEFVVSDPNIAFTPNFRYGVTLFTLLLFIELAGEETGATCSMDRPRAGTVVTPTFANPANPAGNDVTGREINADCPSRNRFSTRKDAEVVATDGCGTSGKVLNKL